MKLKTVNFSANLGSYKYKIIHPGITNARHAGILDMMGINFKRYIRVFSSVIMGYIDMSPYF